MRGPAPSRFTIRTAARGIADPTIACWRWAADSGGRIVPYCRLDPAEDPVGEAQRCLARGARGIKLHPRAQAFGFGNAAAEAIFAVAQDAGVPILVHAGRGMPRMDPLADLARRFPDVTLVLAHTALADQGMFAHRLADHPKVLYDTSCFSPLDVIELFARVPAERIVFASDVPYGRPIGGLYAAMRVAELAGLDASDAPSSRAGRWPPRWMAGRWRHPDRRAWTGSDRSTARSNVRARTC